MNIPIFPPGDDPGPSFAGLLARVGLVPEAPTSPLDSHLTPPHGTTVLAVRYGDGVVIGGDRRATSGNFISHRTIEKVFPADSHSGVAIAGAAGPAVEMVRLFQLQLEHYEKVEGKALSLEGKANQLSQMIRNHLPAAMAGLAVVPIFAGYDLARSVGRLFRYDITGGRYEEADYAASGSGSLHASTVVKLRFRPDLSADEAIDVIIEALFQAADEDSATGGPDPLRGIYPVIATISVAGFERIGDPVLAARFDSLIQRLVAERSGLARGGAL